MIRLRSITIENFRAISHATVPLDRHLTVLVGENASGKTAILDALAAALAPLLFSHRVVRKVEPKDFRLTGLADPLGEVQQEDYISLVIEQYEQEGWECRYRLDRNSSGRPQVHLEARNRAVSNIAQAIERGFDVAPIIASYGADRVTPPSRRDRGSFPRAYYPGQADRMSAYRNALDSRAVYDEAVEWFEAVENLELRSSREAQGSYRDHRLEAVRFAVSKLLPELDNLRMVGLPPRLMIDAKLPGRDNESLSVDQLSGGYRAMLALVMDLARRMADLNPEMTNALEAPGIVLIDEIDLHLHPRWQQLVVHGLRTMFPNVQFILTTHSPQVLTTLEPRNILNLTWERGQLVEEHALSSSGAESGRLLAEIMGVNERPPAEISPFVSALESYRRLVAEGQWDSPAAQRELSAMRAASPDDPVLGALELERKRFAAQRRRSLHEA